MASGISTIISFVTKYAGAGAEAAANGIGKVKNAAGIAMRGISQLGTVVGGLDGKFSVAANGAMNMISSIQQMGAIGGIMAGAQIAITMISQHFIDKAREMEEAVRKAGEKIRNRLEEMNKARMDKVHEALEKATTKAQEAAKAFDTLAAAYMKVEKARVDTEKAGSNSELSAMSLEKSKAMAGAKTDSERAMIGAEWDEKIARKKLKVTESEQSANVAGAEDERTQARHRARSAWKTEADAKEALKKARDTYNEDERTGNDSNIEKSKAEMERAEKAYADAVNDRIAKVADYKAADEKLKQAKINQSTAINDAKRGIVEAESAARQLAEAQVESAKAELERVKAEQKAAESARMKAVADKKRAALAEQKQSAASERDRWQGEFNAAFDLWRDPEAAQQAVDADKRRGEDMKAFRKAVNRYGGKGKIDEYARLMRAGDEEGMQDRLAQWRKSSKFTPQVEQMVKAAAADQNKNAAEKSLAQIEKNTRDLAKKIDDLLSLK